MSLATQETVQPTDKEKHTGVFALVEAHTGTLQIADRPVADHFPPSGAEYYLRHDIATEATESPVLAYDADADMVRDVISTPLTVADASIAIRGLGHAGATKRLRRDYSEELRARTMDRSKAVVDVLIAESLPTTMQPYDSYERMRTGMPQIDGLAPVVKSKSEMQAFTEKPLAPVGPESLALSADEYHVVLDGLRSMAASADRFERLEAMDLLSRLTPSQGERKLYDGLLKESGIRLDVTPQPQYNDGIHNLIQ